MSGLRGRSKLPETRPTVFFVQFLNLESVFAALHHIIVEFVPERQSSKLWAGKFSNGAEIQAIDSYNGIVNDETSDCEQKGASREKLHDEAIRGNW